MYVVLAHLYKHSVHHFGSQNVHKKIVSQNGGNGRRALCGGALCIAHGVNMFEKCPAWPVCARARHREPFAFARLFCPSAAGWTWQWFVHFVFPLFFLWSNSLSAL